LSEGAGYFINLVEPAKSHISFPHCGIQAEKKTSMDLEEKNLQDPTLTHRLFQLITSMSDDERRTLLKLLGKGLLKGRCRREHFRKPLRLSVTYAIGKHAHRDFIKDISLGGVFIFTRTPFQAGQQIRLIFGKKDSGNPVTILGKVARVTLEGIGVKFLSLNNDKKTAILTLASKMGTI
jgi:Tfp pilus assembly protein PilZ